MKIVPAVMTKHEGEWMALAAAAGLKPGEKAEVYALRRDNTIHRYTGRVVGAPFKGLYPPFKGKQCVRLEIVEEYGQYGALADSKQRKRFFAGKETKIISP